MASAPEQARSHVRHEVAQAVVNLPPPKLLPDMLGRRRVSATHGPHTYSANFLRHQRLAPDERHRDAHERAQRPRRASASGRPTSAHDGLLVAHADIAPHRFVQQSAGRPQFLAAEDEVEVASERSPLMKRKEPVIVRGVVRAVLVWPAMRHARCSRFGRRRNTGIRPGRGPFPLR